MKAVDQYIPKAVTLIKQHIKKENKSIPSEYKGYISSMGASIIQSGIVATLAFYSAEDRNTGAAQDKQPVLLILHELLKDRYLLIDDKYKSKNILQYALKLQKQSNRKGLRQLKRDVINASVAMKLALRTFNLESNNTDKA